MIDKIKNDIYKYKLCIFFVIIYLIFMQIFFSTLCPIQALFHVNCPGCGLTHATIYMVTGHFIKAFDANYTVFLWWGLIIILFIDRYIHKFRIKVFPYFVAFVAIITLIRFIIITIK